MFNKIDLRTEVVTGRCPTCDQPTVMISFVTDKYRCINFGENHKCSDTTSITYIHHTDLTVSAVSPKYTVRPTLKKSWFRVTRPELRRSGRSVGT